MRDKARRDPLVKVRVMVTRVRDGAVFKYKWDDPGTGTPMRRLSPAATREARNTGMGMERLTVLRLGYTSVFLLQGRCP